MLNSVLSFIRHHPLLIPITVLATYLRLFKIGDYLTFLGDEGRDVLVAKHILEGDFTLLGPRASAGDFFLGPIYYYMMAPFLWLWHYDPVGPAIMVALFGVATVIVLYLIANKVFGKSAGVIAAFLYSISPLVLIYSRSSWNPNVMPFFTLLCLILTYIAVQRGSKMYFLLSGFVLGIIMQLHYLGTFVAVIVAVFVLLGILLERKKHKWSQVIKSYILAYLSIFFGFLIGFSPFLAFEVRHGFPNIRTIFSFITQNAEKQYVSVSFTSIVEDVFIRVFGRLLAAYPVVQDLEKYSQTTLTIWSLGICVLVVSMIIALWKVKDKLFVLLLILWITLGIVLFGFYKKPIYDYYFGFLFPVPFLLFGNLFFTLFNSKKWSFICKLGALVLTVVLTFMLLMHNPLQSPPNRQKEQARTIAHFVLSKTNGKPFNFALITGGNSDHAYRYYFELSGHSPITIENPIADPKRKTVTDQLLIVCEYPTCDVLGNSLWEVAGFGRAEVVGEWPVSVVRVYKLKHYSASDSAH